MNMLDSMISWVQEVPPLDQGTQRFGNLAFRSYYKLIEEVSFAKDLRNASLPADAS